MTTRTRLDWDTLSMREPDSKDVARYADVLVSGYNEPKNAALLGHDYVMDRNDVIDHYTDLAAEGGRPFMLFHQDVFIGDGDLRSIADGAAELAFLIALPNAQGKGRGTKFALMLATYGFRMLGLSTIFASVMPENWVAARVFEKLGFQLDESPRARSFAEEATDRVFALDRAAFEHLHGASANVITKHPLLVRSL